MASPAALLTALRPFYFASSPPIIFGIVFLAITREFLFNVRLHDYNTPAQLQYQRPEPCGEYCNSCTPRELKYRTYDGHCNNLNLTGMGMSDRRFGRSAVKDVNASDPGLFEPNPYLVAEKLLKRPDGSQREVAEPYSVFMTVWINFVFHDWFNHGTVEENPYVVQWGPKESDTFKLKRTFLDKEGYTINTETPWWDAGHMYGRTEEAASGFRAGGTCELRLLPDGNLPLGPNGIPIVGFNNNWWAGLEIMHVLFTKEHNYVCGMLRAQHPSLSEDDLFETTRLVVAAVIAHIHTVEWTPALLNNVLLDIAMHSNWDGLNGALLQQELAKLSAALPNITDPQTRQLYQTVIAATGQIDPAKSGVGKTTQLSGTPYSFSEDFVSAYRLHALIPDEFSIVGEDIKAEDMLFQKARHVLKQFGVGKILDSFGHQPPTTLTLQNYPNFLTKLTIKGEDGPRNMAVVDVLRDRERGLPRYNEARRQYGIPPATSFENITNNPEWAALLKSVYKSVEDVDFMVGCMAESPRPNGYVISDVAFYVFIINASRRLQCDRFYQEAFNADHYTAEGIAHVQSTTFKSLVLRHYPDLASSIGDVSNAFFRWSGTPAYQMNS